MRERWCGIKTEREKEYGRECMPRKKDQHGRPREKGRARGEKNMEKRDLEGKRKSLGETERAWETDMEDQENGRAWVAKKKK